MVVIVVWLVSVVWGWRPLAAEPALDRQPLTLWAGLDSRGPAPAGDQVLVDARFSPETGYGHVGGSAGRLESALALGGSPDWPIAWREGVERYSVRAARGDYVVELTFIETAVLQPGRRVFDVVAEEKPLFRAVDIARLAGDLTWVTVRGKVSVFDGWLDLRFQAMTPGYPPRVSRVRIRRLGTSGVPTPPRLEARDGPSSVLLRWSAEAPHVNGYGVFRSETLEGSFERLASTQVPWFVDHRVNIGRPYYYKIGAHGLDGTLGPVSEAVEAFPYSVETLGVPVYELYVELEDLDRLAADGEPDSRVPARLVHEDKLHHVFLTTDGTQTLRQKKKSLHVTVDRERNRLFRDRRHFYLSAEAGDPTLLRQWLSFRLAEQLELPTPAVEPVALLLNGEYAGLYFDIEQIDRRFLRRNRLDRGGLLARLLCGDRLEPGWYPVGEKVVKNGSLMSVSSLIHVLNRLDTGHVHRFLQDRIDLDHYFQARAYAAVRGSTDPVAARGRFALRDSRNGKWQFFHQFNRSGDWGVRNLALPSAEVALEPTRRALLGGFSEEESWSILDFRILRQPEFRRRYLEQVTTLLDSRCSSEVFRRVLEQSHATLSKAVSGDPEIWPSVSAGADFEAGPAALNAAFVARAAALRRLVEMERATPEDPLVLSEFLAVPADGDERPWVELHNGSARAVDSTQYYLSDDPRVPWKMQLSAGTLAAGSRTVVRLEEDSSCRLATGGGFVGLYAASPGTELVSAEPRDAVFYGHQSVGRPYGRYGKGGQFWGFLPRATPGEPNQGPALRRLPYDYRHGLSRGGDGDLTLWLQPAWNPRGRLEVDEVLLCWRREKAQTFERVPLVWNGKIFRHEIHLEADPRHERTPFYFLVRGTGGLEQTFPLTAPQTTFFLPVPTEVRINEVLPRPDRRPGQPREFIEIHNAGDQPFDLSGMYLSDSRGNRTKWRIPEGSVVAANGFKVFYATNQNMGDHTNFRLNNSGEFVGLFDRLEDGNLPIDRVTFRATLPGQSWGRSKDGETGFRIWKQPTPGRANMPQIPEEFLRTKQETSTP